MNLLHNNQDIPINQLMDYQDIVSGLKIAEKISLDNGVQVYILNANDLEMIKMTLVFKAGSYFQDKILTAFFTRKMMAEGTEKSNARQIAEIFDFYGASFDVSNGLEFFTFHVTCLSKYLDKIIDIIAEILFMPAFPELELQLHKENKIRDITLEDKKVREVVRNRFCAMLFGKEHPYGRYASQEDVHFICREDLVVFYHQFIKNADFQIILAGSISAAVLKLVNLTFGRHSVAVDEKLIKRSFPILANKEKHQFFPVEDVVQSAFRIGTLAVNRLHSDYAGLNVLNTVLGGYFGSRLMRNLREDKGYTYGVSSVLLSFADAGYFFAASEVKGEHTSKAIEQVYLEMNKLREEIVPDEELERVKNYLFGRYLRSIDGVYAQSELLLELFRFGQDFSFYSNYLMKMGETTVLDLNVLARKYLNTDEMFEAVAGVKQ